MRYLPQSKLFKKYIGSYILVFSIPFIAFLFVINYMYISSVREELIASNENFLDHSNNLLDENILEVRALGNYINQTDDFSQFAPYYSDTYNTLRSSIKQHEHSSAAVNAIYVVYRNSGNVFSSRGKMSIDAMIDHSTHFRGVENKEMVKEKIATADNAVNVLDNQLVYMMPLGGNGLDYGTIIMVMNSYTIQANINMLYDSNAGMSFLIDKGGEVVLSSALYPKLTWEEMTEVLPETYQADEIRISGTEYMTNTVDNDLSDLRFVSLTDTQVFFQPLNRVLWFSFAGVMALILSGLLISYYFASQNYQPISKILNKFDKDRDSRVDEWSIIQSNINETYSEVELLSSIVDQHAPIVRNALLLDMIEGRYHSEDKFEKQLTDNNVIFPYKNFAMLILEIGDKTIAARELINVEKLSHDFNSQFQNETYTIASTIPHLKNNQIFIVANTKKNDETIWNKLIDEIIQHTQEVIDDTELVIKLGAGSAYKEWYKTKNSFIEASSSLEKINKDKATSNTVLYFKDIKDTTDDSRQSHRSVTIDYPEENFMLLIQSMKQGNETIAQEQIADIFGSITTPEMPKIGRQAIIAYLFNALIKSARDWELSEYSNQLCQLDTFENVTLAQKLLVDMTRSISREVNKKIEDESNEIGHNITDYIFNNYCSPDVALDQLASRYDISISYASKLIKEETGESFTTIIQSLRMNRFKDLLISTSRPIKELVVEVGYYDVSNFTRKFRKENELTPGQYRKKYKDKLSSSELA